MQVYCEGGKKKQDGSEAGGKREKLKGKKKASVKTKAGR